MTTEVVINEYMREITLLLALCKYPIKMKNKKYSTNGMKHLLPSLAYKETKKSLQVHVFMHVNALQPV